MKRIILTRGIPASGKSTWAKQEVLKDPEHSIRINRDDLRNMSGQYWVPAREDYIKACKGTMLMNAINFKFDTIIIDEMNLNPKETGYLKEVVSMMNDTFKDNNDKYIIRGIFNKYKELKDSSYINGEIFGTLNTLCMEIIKLLSSIILTTRQRYFGNANPTHNS